MLVHNNYYSQEPVFHSSSEEEVEPEPTPPPSQSSATSSKEESCLEEDELEAESEVQPAAPQPQPEQNKFDPPSDLLGIPESVNTRSASRSSSTTQQVTAYTSEPLGMILLKALEHTVDDRVANV